ncbi:nucleoside ABC transporter ATP-binding protein [Breznakia blatticola]|uniref:Nucleoside ABC transporter ATP-binding protein n=1 Tax=Breznakia blatticola TaxID=1754012 RepID=A0A4R8A564_9FIRM|nr:ABC transporter ATP-binding protein [Breznakia blatticola]TDW25770.1 nucleoside ABC transporter ATP-binding protein [Breznakia blatticola]
MAYAVEMLNITKEFPGIKANDNITLRLKEGSIHALLGENGAGKSTLMSILFGLYQPTSGVIKVHGETIKEMDPNLATELKIGMVHQHFKLIESFTVAENIILGDEPVKNKMNVIDIKTANRKIKELSEQYGFNVDPNAKISDISVGMQQKVEILKMLYRDANILIFDEPTAVLTPQEIDDLIEIMKRLVKEGKSILLITHKLIEIKSVADECTILRRGKYIDTVDVKTTSIPEMAEMMVGRNVNFTIDKKPANPKEVILDVKNLCVENESKKQIVKDFSFDVRAGEIVGLAGVDGNGQSELIYALAGLMKASKGEILLCGEDIRNCSVKERFDKGMGHIPEDRHKYGLVLDFLLKENLILQSYADAPYAKHGILQMDIIDEHANKLIDEFDVRSGEGKESLTRSMSGGNQQKAIIARELDRSPKLLLVVQPTRGLDVGAIEYIHGRIVEERDNGKAVLLMSLDLDEILDLSDRIVVIHDGERTAFIDRDKTDFKDIGLYMAGEKHKEDTTHE